MVSNLIKISICATSFVVIGALGQHPLWAFNDSLLTQTYSTNSDADQPEVPEAGDHSEDANSPNLSLEQPTGMSAAHVSTYMKPYTNKFFSGTSPRKRKIPEPSALIGLIAIAGCLGMQQRKMKKS